MPPGPMRFGYHDQLGTKTDLGGKATRGTPGWACPSCVPKRVLLNVNCCTMRGSGGVPQYLA